MENQKRSRLYQALLCRDPVVRKQLVNNVMKLPEYGYIGKEKEPLIWLFDWCKSPEKGEYWEEQYQKTKGTSEYWAEHPILDGYTLPQKYQVQCPDPIPDEWNHICQLASGDSGGGDGGIYYLFGGPEDGYDIGDEKYPDVPEIDYSTWVLAVENQYGGKKQEPHKYKAGDWVTITHNMGGDLADVVTQITRLDTNNNVWIRAMIDKRCSEWFHTPDTLRPATPKEIIKAKYPVGTRVKVVDGKKDADSQNGKYGTVVESPGVYPLYVKIEDGGIWGMSVDAILEIDTRVQPIGWKPGGKYRAKGSGKDGLIEKLDTDDVLVWTKSAYGESKCHSVEEVNKWVENGQWIIQKPADTRVPLSFKTEDGYTLYQQDKVWWIYRGSSSDPWDWNPHKRDQESVVEAHKQFIKEGTWRVFHSKENAEKWIEQQNRILQKPLTVSESFSEIAMGPTPPWSIVTTDGVRVYEGSTVWWRSPSGSIHQGGTISAEDSIQHGYKMFSTQSAAKEYKKEQCGEKPTYPEYKVGQRVLVHSGANMRGYDGLEGEITEIDTDYIHQPCIRVKDDKGGWPWCYPEPDRVFNVEILQEPSVPLPVDCIPTDRIVLPERRWKIGDRYKHYTDEPKSDGWVIQKGTKYPYKVVWMENGKEEEYDNYTKEQLDRYIEDGTWIPYNPQPVPVTKDNAVVGMKVVRGKDWDWGDDGYTTPSTVGTIVEVEDGTHPTVMVQWPTDEMQKMYYIGGYNRYDLYIAETNTITNINQNTNNQKTTNNEKSDSINSKDSNISNYKINKEVHPEHSRYTGSKSVQPAIYIRSNPEVVDGHDYYGGKVTAATCKIQPTVS